MTVRLPDDLNPLERLTVTPMSYSRLNTYKMCNAKYFYSYVLREPRQFAPYAVMGNIIHSTFENVLTSEKTVSDLSEDILEEYKVQLGEWDPDDLIPEQLQTDAVVMVNEFIDRHGDEQLPITEKEIGFQIVIGSYIFRGYIDRLDVIGDMVYVIDWKTGKREVPLKHIAKDLQLGLYALAMNKLYPDKQVYASLYYLRSGRQKGHLFTQEDLVEVEKSLIEASDTLINDSHFHTTPNRFLCGFCDHAKSGTCPMGKYAK